MGRLGLTSPSSSVLRSATTLPLVLLDALVSLGHRYLVCSFGSCPVSGSLALRNSCANARPVWSPGTPFLRGSYKETFGSPKFPGYPLELMPCSSTPVVTSALAFAHSGLLPSTSMTALAFPPIFRRLSLVIFFHLSTIIQISGLNCH